MSNPPPLPSTQKPSHSGFLQTERILKAVVYSMLIAGACSLIFGLLAGHVEKTFHTTMVTKGRPQSNVDNFKLPRYTATKIVHGLSLNNRWQLTEEEAIDHVIKIFNFRKRDDKHCEIIVQDSSSYDIREILSAWGEVALDWKSESMIHKNEVQNLIQNLQQLTEDIIIAENRLDAYHTISSSEHERIRLKYLEQKANLISLSNKIKTIGVDLSSRQEIVEDHTSEPPESNVSKLAQFVRLGSTIVFIVSLLYFLPKALRPLKKEDAEEAMEKMSNSPVEY